MAVASASRPPRPSAARQRCQCQRQRASNGTLPNASRRLANAAGRFIGPPRKSIRRWLDSIARPQAMALDHGVKLRRVQALNEGESFRLATSISTRALFPPASSFSPEHGHARRPGLLDRAQDAGRSRSSARWRDSRASISPRAIAPCGAARVPAGGGAAPGCPPWTRPRGAGPGRSIRARPSRQPRPAAARRRPGRRIEPGAPREVRHPSYPGLHAATASGCGAPSQREASGKGSASGAHRDDQR